MDSPLQQALADICSQLDERSVRFALIGGIAASLRGRLRTTEDIDLVVMTDVDGALNLAASLDAQKFVPLFPDFEKVVRTAHILALEHRPTSITLDLAIAASGFEQQVIQRADLVNIADIQVYVSTAEDLILMKMLAGRPQDEQDIAGIVAEQRGAIDWKYCESVACQLEEVMEMDLVKVLRRLQAQ